MQRRRHINFVRSGAGRPGARRWAVVCGLLLSLVAWGHGAGARGRDRDGGAGSEAGAAQAARLLADGRVALAAGDVATAYRLAAGSYRGSPTPDALALLGRVALAENRVVAAQDLMRRYLADPNLDAASESADQAEAQRILERPRPAAAQIQITGDRGTLVSLDERLVGALPLVKPLLVTPGEHKVVLERRSTRLEDTVRVGVGRLGELRVNLATKALVLTILPGVLVRHALPGLSAADAQGVEGTVEAALVGARLSAISERDAAECGEPPPGACSDPVRCEVERARQCESDYVLRSVLERTAGPTPGLRLQVEIVDVSAGDVSATDAVSCSGCGPTELRQLLAARMSTLMARGIGRARGQIDVQSDPSSAMVWIDGRAVGVTPYRGVAFAGLHQVAMRREGYSEYAQSIDVREGETAHVAGSLGRSEAAPAVERTQVVVEKQPGRPLWRLLSGGIAIGAGVVLLGFGASAVSINGQCVDRTITNLVNCQTVYKTAAVGGTLMGLGGALMIGGAVMIALPAPRTRVAAPRGDGAPR